MKKSAIAVAVATALGTSAVALAETTLYGSARVSVDYSVPDTINKLESGTWYSPSGDVDIPDNNKYMDVWDNGSRLGVRGSEDLGSGISAIYQFEFGVDVPGNNNYWSDSDNRPRLVGLKGDFGAITLGTQYTPYYNVIGYTDTFNSTKTFGQDYFLRGNTTLGNPVFFQKGIAEKRKGDSVVYTTPNWQGLSAQAMAVMDGRPGANFVDIWEANLTYQNGPWFAGAAFLQNRNMSYGPLDLQASIDEEEAVFNDSKHHDNQYGAAVGWDNKQFGVAFSWQQYNPDEKITGSNALIACIAPACDPGEIAGLVVDRINAYTLQGQYYWGSEVFRLTGSYMKPSSANTKLWTVEAGFQHNLSKRTRLWLEYIYTKQEFQSGRALTEDANGNLIYGGQNSFGDSNMHVVSAGVRHDF